MTEPQEGTNNPDGNGPPPDNKSPKKWEFERRVNIVDACGAVVNGCGCVIAIVLLVFVGWEYRQLIRTNKIADESLKTSIDGFKLTKKSFEESLETSMNAERAHLLFKQVTVHGIREIAEGKPIQGGKIFITYTMRNYGNTPAWTKNITFQILVSRDRYLPPAVYDNPTRTRMKYPILPNVDFDTFYRFEIRNYTLTTEQAKDILAGKQYLFVYGFIRYRDVFKRRRSSHFAYWYHFNFYGGKTNSTSGFAEPTGTRDHWRYK